jgi:hypothetical protein
MLLRLDHYRFLPEPFHFVTRTLSTTRRYVTLTLKASFNDGGKKNLPLFLTATPASRLTAFSQLDHNVTSQVSVK